MPRLQAVVRVCDLAILSVSLSLPVLACCRLVAFLINLKVKNHEKSLGSSAIVLRSTCGIGDFSQFLPTTICKQGITCTSYYYL